MKTNLSDVGTIKAYKSTIKVLKSQKKKTGVPIVKLIESAVNDKFAKMKT